MGITFGEWARWVLARKGLDRAAVAAALGCDKSTVTHLYKRDEPNGVNDVFLSRLATLLGMSEPELMVKWMDGLPEQPAEVDAIAAKLAGEKKDRDKRRRRKRGRKAE